jgi:hypothetical protein
LPATPCGQGDTVRSSDGRRIEALHNITKQINAQHVTN